MNIKIAILEDNNIQAGQLIKIINNWGNNKLHAISIPFWSQGSIVSVLRRFFSSSISEKSRLQFIAFSSLRISLDVL